MPRTPRPSRSASISSPLISCPSCNAYYAGMTDTCGNGHTVCQNTLEPRPRQSLGQVVVGFR